MRVFFGFECRSTTPVALKDVATSGLVDGEQLLCSDAFDYLKRRRAPRDVFAQIAVTMQDLTPGEGWNFVYGQASLMDGVGVFSFARYSANFIPGESTRARRLPLTELERAHLLLKSCKTMAHEVTHILGLRHCIYFQCLMNGNNGDEHAPLQLCPVCLRKVHDACKDVKGGEGVDVVTRYKALGEFYDQHGWEEPLAFARARHAALSEICSQGKETFSRNEKSSGANSLSKRRRQGARVALGNGGTTRQDVATRRAIISKSRSENDQCKDEEAVVSNTRQIRVAARSGLILRAGPEKTSERVGTVEFNDYVFVATGARGANTMRTASGTKRVELRTASGGESRGWATAVSKRGRVLLDLGA